MGAGYVGILSVELHFPENHSLKGKRKELLSVKAQLQRRFGASVAEVDYHDLWQRSRLTLSCVARSYRDAEVRALFRASRLGVIAGCMVTRGVIRRNSQIRVVREGAVVYETTIASLKRFKDDVREVQEGFECGILLENFNDVKEGDILEAYETRQIERTDLEVTGGNGGPPPPDEPAEEG